MVSIISDELKSARQKFVSGLTGSTPAQAWALCGYQAVSGYLRDSFVSLLVARSSYFRSLLERSPNEKHWKQKRNVAFAVDFFTMIFPSIMICVFADYVFTIFFSSILLAMTFQWFAHGKFAFASLWHNSRPCFEVTEKPCHKVNIWFYKQANTFLLMGMLSCMIR